MKCSHGTQRTLITRNVTLSCLAICVVAGGCSSPLSFTQSDYEEVSADRIQNLRALDLTGYKANTPPTSAAEHVDPFAGLEQVELSLDAVRTAAIDNNLDIKEAQLAPEIANQAVHEEIARFETVFRVDGTYSETDQPTASTLNSAEANSQFIQPSLTRPLLTGGRVDISVPYNRVSTNNTFTTLNPSYDMDFVVRLTQPLLRNAGRRTATAPARLAALDRWVTDVRTRSTIASTLSAIDRAYWDLWSSRQQLDLRIEEFEVAREILDQAKRLVEAGQVAEVEVIRAQAGVSDRVSAILQLEQVVLRRQRELKRSMNLDSLSLSNDVVIIPTSDPQTVPFELDADELLTIAKLTRPELLELELQLLADATRIDVARNSKLPQLDVTATYRRNGLGSDSEGAFRNALHRDFEDYTLAVAASIPIGNKGATARLRRALLQRMSRIINKKAREQTIEQDVLNAIERMRTDWQRINASRQSVALNARSLAAEQRQFAQGLSTSVDVLEAASKLASARAGEIAATADYQIGQIALAESTGTVLGQSIASGSNGTSPSAK